MGSVLFLAAWGVLMGPFQYGKLCLAPIWQHTFRFSLLLIKILVQHLISGPRLPFTAAYFGSIALTLFFSLGVSRIRYTSPCKHYTWSPTQPLSIVNVY
jgi:hypothetical protein